MGYKSHRIKSPTPSNGFNQSAAGVVKAVIMAIIVKIPAC